MNSTPRLKLSVSDHNALRHRARTDLFWLATEILGYRDLVDHVHRPLCNFLVQKDPTKKLAEQDEIKERLVLDPRGIFKTTIVNVADSVQWILCFPHIRILDMTGKRELAEMVLKQTKEHFMSNDKLRALFPEMCPKANDDFGNTTEFTVPVKGRTAKEPTMLISSGGSVKAGFHFDLIKCDDLVHEENVGTAEQVAKTIDVWNYTTPLLEPYGYRDTIGTRYDHSDLYGFLKENRPDVAVFERAAGRLTEDGRITDLLFPERLTEKWLLQQRASNPYIFACQYLNSPTMGGEAYFSKELIESHTIPAAHVQRTGGVFICWDLGFSQKQFADFSVGAVGMFDGTGRCFILDLCVGRFGSWELIENFFKLLIKWKPSRVAIEQAAGSPLLAPALERRAHDLRMSLPLDWLPAGNQKARKVTAIAGLQSLLKQDKLYFVAGLPHYDEMVKQFVRFPKYKHDDIPDSVSMLMHYRDRVDYYMPDSEVEFAHVQPIEGCEVLGTGLIG